MILLLFSYPSLKYCLCSPFSYHISILFLLIILSRSYWICILFLLFSTQFVLAWFSLYPVGTVGSSFSNALFSYANFDFPSIQLYVLSIVILFHCEKCSIVVRLLYIVPLIYHYICAVCIGNVRTDETSFRNI